MTSRDLDAQTRPQWVNVCDTETVIIEDKHIKSGLLNLLYGGETSETFCLSRGNVKFGTKNRE